MPSLLNSYPSCVVLGKGQEKRYLGFTVAQIICPYFNTIFFSLNSIKIGLKSHVLAALQDIQWNFEIQV